MSNAARVAEVLERIFGQYQEKPVAEPGLLGDGNGNVSVPNRPRYVYARMLSQLDVPFEVFNDRTPFVDNLPVLIGYDPDNRNLLQVLKVRLGITDESAGGITYPTGVPNHGASHEWLSPYGGYDIAFIHIRQWLPLRVYGSSSGVKIKVYPGYVFCASSQEYLYVSPSETDLAAHLPSVGSARWALVSVTEAGAIRVTLGTAVSLYSLTLADIPAITQGDRPLAAVRLYGGQTRIRETRTITDIVDLRFPIATGAGSGLVADHAITADTATYADTAGTSAGGGGGGASPRRLARISASAGGDSFYLPDLAATIYRVAVNGYELDPLLYSHDLFTNILTLNSPLEISAVIVVDYEAQTR